MDVVLTGNLLPGTDYATAVQAMAALTRLDPSKVEGLLQSGRPTVVKRDVNAEVGERYRTAFTNIGVETVLRSSETIPAGQNVSSSPLESPETRAPQPTPPASTAEPMAANPQGAAATAQRDHSRRPEAGRERHAIPAPGSSEAGPRTVPASHGWRWMKEAADLFMEEQSLWTSMPLVQAICITLLALIPVLGGLLSVLIGPVFIGGLMLAAHGQQQGQPLRFAALFDGFGPKRGQLLAVGGLQMVAALIIGVVVGVGAIAVARFNEPMQAVAMVANSPFMALFLGIAVLLVAVAMGMAFWFAPCLVAIGDKTAWQSIGISFGATLRNWSAFLVFGLVSLAALVVVMVVLLVAGFIFQFALRFNIPEFVLQIGLLVLLSPIIGLFTLTLYTAYRDIFLSRE